MRGQFNSSLKVMLLELQLPYYEVFNMQLQF